MRAIVEARLANAHIAAVISNRPNAAGLAWAAQSGIPTVSVDHTSFTNRETFDQQLMQTIDQFTPDLVVLAGFMRILTSDFTHHYQGRLVNIHPSLLPAFPGLDTHQRVIDAGCKVTGCTIHFVTAELDHGPIIAQGVVPVLSEDTSDAVAQRVLAIEHRLYPMAIQWFIDGKLKTINGRVIVDSPPHMPLLFTSPALIC